MRARLFRCLTLLLLLISCVGLDAAPPPGKAPVIDFSKLPPGTIFIIGDDAKDVLQQPGVIVLTPEKFKELQDQIDQLKKQASPDKPETPSRCRLTGRVDGDLVHLQAQFEFETRAKKSLVALGCNKAWPTATVLDDGKLPLLPPPGEDGFVVQIDQPGPHRLTLDLDVPVTGRGAKGAEAAGSDRGFEMGLPRAAITIIDALDLPDSVKEVRFGTRSIPAKEISSHNGQRKTVALGPVDKLEVSWKGPAQQRLTKPILKAEGQIEVRVDDTRVITEADLTLRAESGLAAEWQIQAPPPPLVELTVEDDRGLTITPPTSDAKNPQWTIKREPSAEPLKVRLTYRQPRQIKQSIAIGPFAVKDAMKQYGQITVSVPADLRPRFQMRGEMSQREVPEDKRAGSNTVAAFNYWKLPPPPKPNEPVPALLEMTLEPIKGAVETSVAYTLRLTEQGWTVTAEIDVNPVRTTLERLEVELPTECEWKAGPPLIAEPELEPKDGVKRAIKLAKKHNLPFKVVLEGTVVVGDGKQALTLSLPRPLLTQDKGARVTVTVPEGTELLVARDTGIEILPGKREQSWRTERMPARVELAWQPHRPELVAEVVADVTLGDRQIAVQERLVFRSLPDAQRALVLHTTEFPAGRSPAADRATLQARGPGAWAVVLKEPALTLRYAVPLPEKGRRAVVPLFWPDKATRCTMNVRVWSDSATQPVLESAAWEERPIEVVADRDSLPALVLSGNGVQGAHGLEFPLALKLTDPAVTSLAAVAFDRALIQAAVVDGGAQVYRARLLLHKINSRTLDLELPAAPEAVNLEAWLDGKRLTTWQTLDDEGREAESGRIARLRVEPELYRKPVVLELRYRVGPSRIGGSWQTTLSPPVLRGNVLSGRVRWQVATPADWVIISTGAAVADQRWGLRQGLPAPRPAATSADLERWFNGGSEAVGPGPDDTDFDSLSTELVAGQPVLGPLTVTHCGQQIWLLICSLAVVAVALLLYSVPLPRAVFWGVLAGLAMLALVAALLGPRTIPVIIYGCEPGAAVMLIVIGVQWLVQRRYRRQLVFMPAFTRVAPGSSILRKSNSNSGANNNSSNIGSGSGSGRRHEPSTVDAPPGALGLEIGSGVIRLPGRDPG